MLTSRSRMAIPAALNAEGDFAMKTRKLFLAVLVVIGATLIVGVTGCKKRDAKPVPQATQANAPAPDREHP